MRISDWSSDVCSSDLYDRERKLWKEKVSAEQDYPQARAALYETEIALQNVKQKLIAIGVAGDSPSLSRLELRAPFDCAIKIGRTSCRERVCQYVWYSGVAVVLKKKKKKTKRKS